MVRKVVALLVSALALYLVLVLPNHPRALTPAAFATLPLELPVLLAACMALSAAPMLSRLLRVAIALTLTLMVLLKLADFTTFQAFSRPFNAVLDMFMVPSAMNLLSGTLGAVGAVLVALVAVLAVVALAALLYWATTRWTGLSLPPAARKIAGVTAIALTAVAVADTGRVLKIWDLPVNPPGTAFTARLGVEHVQRGRRAARDLADYRTLAANDPYDGATGLFDLLDGRDVLVIFVESYGRTSFDNPLYAPTHVPTLTTAEHAIAAKGLSMRSGWLTSPIAGGQSWLAHGTFASGLKTDDQARYGAMLASPRQTLFHLASGAGYRTGAVMPAITLPWPEGPLIGFERILNAADLEYKGAPFNWVTMPDQYTLSAYPDLLGADPRPDFLQIALISSHAPWVPVPEMIDWDRVGDGRIFDQWALSGDSPRVVWKDRDRVRDQYRMAIDYALQAVFSYVARRGDAPPRDMPLVMVLGDHPPAGFVSQIDSGAVPIHMIGPADVIARLDGWGFTPGLVPDDTTPHWPMESFRDRFIDVFTSAPEARGGT